MQAVLLSGCRTPIGTFLGNLSSLSATQLGAVVVRETVRRSGLSSHQIDEVIMGNVLSAGLGQAPARQAALLGGLPATVAALTINKMCGSSLKAVMLAAQAVQLGDSQAVLAGGMESMSRAPHLLSGGRTGWKFGDQKMVDSMLHDGLTCAFDHCHMGSQADTIARVKQITRQEQDHFANESQHRAVVASQSGWFEDEMVAVDIPTRDGTQRISEDQGPRPNTNLEKLAHLKPTFDPAGTVTAGNASQLSDGAAAVLVSSEEFADEHGCKPLARIVGYATAGVEPQEVFIAPVAAIHAVLKKTGLNLEDIDLFEINEAFAAQTLACAGPFNIPSEKLNVHGGAIALGHPLGASGARVLVTLLYAMQRLNRKRGLATLCLGGGNAVAMVLERICPDQG
jgi:acetyl-CoA C-acetyltransferase